MGRTTRTRRTVLASLAAAAMAGASLVAAAPTASAAGEQQVRVVTANVNFALDGATVKARFDNYAARADIVLLQEAKALNLHALFADDPDWIVRQYRPQAGDTTAEVESKRGSAVLVRRTAVQSVDAVELRYGTDRSDGGAECDIMPRYVAHVRIVLANGAVLRAASAHLPPPRCQSGTNGPYERMIQSIKGLSDTYPDRLLIGGDWNKVVKSDPNELSVRTGGRIVPRAPEGSIDGFYKPRDLPQVGSADTVGFASDGHLATRIIVSVPSTF
jgi:endonuclease/exonuclease/phosphatase family metal-dependent hydrolase